jgi:hypothetical protein
MGHSPGGSDRVTGALAGGAIGVLVGGILMAFMYGGKGLEGYAGHLPMIALSVLSIGGVGTLVGLLAGVTRKGKAKSGGDAARQSLATLFVLIAAFCAYGFLASFEPGPYLAFRIGYPALGAFCLLSAGWLVRKQ